ncbi:MAG: hypothetical protein IIB39_01760 [Candidatus Marinimicrobia bacterium]|nr:hypothetical protein [Candidatus Neomarinimicrobiota bacterium]
MRSGGWNLRTVDLSGIPLHPQIVHFPIALITVSFLIDLVGVITGSKKWTQFGGILLSLAVFSSLIALLTGQSSEQSLKPMSDILHEAVEEHEGMATRVFFFFLIIAVLRGWLQLKGIFNSWKQWGYVILAGAGVILILRVGQLGGTLVYKHGAGVQTGDSTQISE